MLLTIFIMPPPTSFLVFDEGEVGLDAGGVAVHHEADGAGGGEDGDLGVAVAVLFAVGEGSVPGVLGFLDEGVEVRGDEGLGWWFCGRSRCG